MNPEPRTESAPHFTRETVAGRLARHAWPYSQLAMRALLNRVPIGHLLRSQRPFLLPDADSPPVVSVEFTNECQLRCVYCDNSLRLMPRGFMSPATFSRLLVSVRELDSMIKVVGNGECTLHPRFPEMIRELSRASRHLYVLTNGNWPDPSIASALLHAHVVGFSIDAGTREEYERSRLGGDFDRLLRNLKMLQELARKQGRPTVIVVRLMLRPSQLARQSELVSQWRGLASAVFRQYVFRMSGVTDDGDVFTQPNSTPGFLPRCGSPFRDLDVNWTGNVPLCSGSARQVGDPGLLLGNVKETSLKDLWNGPVMRQYRDGHRTGNHDLTPVCAGCTARY